ncbi:MAG: SPOR domain-containing protein [bacterium]
MLLGSLSLVIAFYLGLTTGMSLRSPEPEAAVSLSQELENQEVSAEDMQFFKLAEEAVEEPAIDLESLNKLREKTSTLTEEVTRVATEPAPDKVEEPQPIAAKPPEREKPKPRPQPIAAKPAPAPSSPSRQADESYTIQISSNRVLENAEDTVTRLNENGVRDAYIDKYVSPSNRVLYRVRVGKMSRSTAETRAAQLKRLPFIQEANITRL